MTLIKKLRDQVRFGIEHTATPIETQGTGSADGRVELGDKEIDRLNAEVAEANRIRGRRSGPIDHNAQVRRGHEASVRARNGESSAKNSASFHDEASREKNELDDVKRGPLKVLAGTWGRDLVKSLAREAERNARPRRGNGGNHRFRASTNDRKTKISGSVRQACSFLDKDEVEATLGQHLPREWKVEVDMERWEHKGPRQYRLQSVTVYKTS